MKKRDLVKTMVAAVMAAAVLTACGKTSGVAADSVAYEMSTANTASYDSGGGYLSTGVAMFDEIAEEKGYDDAAVEVSDGDAQEQQDVLAGRKLIKTVNMSVETEAFDELVPALEQRVASLGGYIEDMSSYNRGGNYSPDYIGIRHLRFASMTIRIPKDKLDTFLSAVAEQSNIVSRSESVTDVTLQYVDLESHKKALTTEQDRLLELMERAETVEDIITIEGRLSEVRYQIESMESQLRTFDNKIDYSTVYLSIDEVEQYTPTEETTVGQRISSGFMESLRGVGRGVSNFTIWFVIHIPYIVVWAIIIIVIFLIIRAVRRAMVKRSLKKGSVKNNPYTMQNAQQQDTRREQKPDEIIGSAENDGAKDSKKEDNPTES